MPWASLPCTPLPRIPLPRTPLPWMDTLTVDLLSWTTQFFAFFFSLLPTFSNFRCLSLNCGGLCAFSHQKCFHNTHVASLDCKMCVVKTFSMMRKRAETTAIPRRTSDIWKKQNKKRRSGEKKKREILSSTRTALTWTAPHFPGTHTPDRSHPDANLPQPSLVEHGRAHELDAKNLF